MEQAIGTARSVTTARLVGTVESRAEKNHADYSQFTLYACTQYSLQVGKSAY